MLLATAGYYGVSVVVKRTNREIKREANSCMGPMQSNLQEAMRARAVADAMGCQEFFIERHHKFADNFNRANFAAYGLLSWMQMVGVYFSFFISVSIGIYGEDLLGKLETFPNCHTMQADIETLTHSLPVAFSRAVIGFQREADISTSKSALVLTCESPPCFFSLKSPPAVPPILVTRDPLCARD